MHSHCHRTVLIHVNVASEYPQALLDVYSPNGERFVKKGEELLHHAFNTFLEEVLFDLWGREG